MNNKIIWALAITALALSGCTTTQQLADVRFQPPEGDYRLIVLQPDVSVGLLTAGGMVEPREEWTLQARENVLKAVTAQQAGRGGETKIALTSDEAGGDADLVADLVWLHKAVGQAIATHKYLGQTLPTKQNQFDWTLGERAVEFGALNSQDYALFLHAEDSFSSGGRVALQVAGFLACATGVCVVPGGGRQAAFASLVDLKTGKIVWFNILVSSVGDIRTPEGAEKMVQALLGKMTPGAAATPAKARAKTQVKS